MLCGLTFELTDKEKQLVNTNRKIEAINEIIKRTECRLKDGKESVRRYLLDLEDGLDLKNGEYIKI